MIWCDGELVDREPAAGPMRKAFGAFSTAGCDHGRPMLWEQHAGRLRATLEALDPGRPVRLPASAEIEGLLAARELVGPARLRVVARRAISGGWTVEATAARLDRGGRSAAPVELEVIRWPAAPPFAGHKTLARLPWDQARETVMVRGADDALIVTSGEQVLETSIANLVAVVGSAMVTPPAPAACLPGIMRAWVLEQAPGLGLAVEERPVTLGEVLDAAELWTTNAVQGPRRVARVGARRWQRWPLYERFASLGVPAPGW